MHKHILILTLCMMWSSLTSLGAAETDIDPSDFGSESIGPAPNTPLSINSSFDYISNSKIAKGFFKNDEVRFAEGTVDAGFVFYYSPAYSEATNLSLGYTETLLDWEQNPWFSQKRFSTVSLALGGFTGRLSDWMWRGQLQVNYDTGSQFSAEYFNYDLILWGRYSTWESFGLHIGLVAQTGMRMDRVFPILGIDWQISKKWKLSAIFPMNISLEYAATSSWFLSIAARAFDSRHRVKDNESHPRSVVRYLNAGAECMVKYAKGLWTFNIHGGTTLGGRYRIANQRNHYAHNYKLKPSPYGGLEADLKF